MMFEPGLTRGTLEVLVAPPQHPHCAADDQSTKAIDIQNAYLNGTVARPPTGEHSPFPSPGLSQTPAGACPPAPVTAPQGRRKSRTKRP